MTPVTRLILSFLLLSLIPSVGWGATVYIGKVNGVPYYSASWTSCSQVANTGTQGGLTQAANALGNNGELKICPPTQFVFPVVWSGTDLGAASWLGSSRTGQTIGCSTNNKADCILDGAQSTGNDVIGNVLAGMTFHDLTIKNSPSGKYAINSATAFTGRNLDLTDNDRGLYLRDNASGTYVLDKVKVRRSTGSPVASSGAHTETWTWPIFEDNGAFITYYSNITASYIQGHSIGFPDLAYASNSGSVAPNVTWTNHIFGVNNLEGNPNSPVIQTWGAGSWTFNNCLQGDGAIGKAQFIANTAGTATITINNSPDTYVAKWVSPRTSGRTFFCIDDTPNLNNWYTLADLANTTYGFPVVFAMFQSGAGAVNWGKIARYINRGNEIAAHGEMFLYTGTGDTVNAFVAKASAGSIVISPIAKPDPNDSSTWTGTIQGPGQAAFQLQNHTVWDAEQYLLTCTGVTIGSATGQLDWNLSATDLGVRAATLSPGTYALTSGGVTITFTQADLFQYSMVETKAWLESHIRAVTQDDIGNPIDMSSWTCKSFVWPGGWHNTTAETYALGTAGYLQVRGVQQINNASYSPNAYKLAAAGSLNYYTALGTTDADILKEGAGFFESLTHFGGAGGCHGHSFTDSGLANWTSLFNAASGVPGLTVTTFSGAMDWIRSHADHTTANVAYRCADGTGRCIVDQANYRIRPSSPARGAGDPTVCVILGDATYADGTPMCVGGVAVGGKVNIGAYGVKSAVGAALDLGLMK